MNRWIQAYQHPIMEDPPSLLVDSDSPWQIPDSPLISEEPDWSPTGVVDIPGGPVGDRRGGWAGPFGRRGRRGTWVVIGIR